MGGGARVDYARVGDALRAARGPSHGRAVASGGFLSAASAVFLPEGYPATVAPEYLTFQAWDTVQASCSYLRGILATQALLGAVGVGDGRATALAATLAWVLRDGAGMVGSLVFAWWGAARFDADGEPRAPAVPAAPLFDGCLLYFIFWHGREGATALGLVWMSLLQWLADSPALPECVCAQCDRGGCSPMSSTTSA